jgi:hypothetical protein
LLLALVSLLVIASMVEIGLRLAGYGANRGPCFQGYDGAGIILMCYDRNPDGYLDVDLTKRSAREKLYNNYGIIDMERTYQYTPYGVVTPVDERKMRPGQFRPKTPGKIRLIAIGDSFTYGHSLKLGDPWPSQLEAILNQGAGGSGRFEVLNWGIGNTDIPQIAALLFNRALPEGPDAVVYAWCLNDPMNSQGYVDAYKPLLDRLRETGRHIPDRYASIGWTEVTGWRRWCAMYDLFRQKWDSRDLGKLTVSYTNDAYGPVNGAGWAQSEQLLARMGQACREKGAALHVAIWPMLADLGDSYPFVPAHKAIVEACGKAAVPVLDLRDRLKAYSADKLIIHPEDRHPNKLACRVAAQAISDHLRQYHAAWFK